MTAPQHGCPHAHDHHLMESCSCGYRSRPEQMGPVDPSPPDTAARLAAFEQMCDGIRQISEMLTGMVVTLTKEGWSEQQARDIVTATLLMQARNPAKPA